MHQIITIASGKGGSGKTTIATNLAGALATEHELSVLVVDVDPQGAASACLGVAAEAPGIWEVLTGECSLIEATRETMVDGLFVMPATLQLGDGEVWLPDQPGWRLMLRDRLAALRGADIVIVDTAPGSAVLPILGLYTADLIYIAAEADYLSVRTVPQAFAGITEVMQRQQQTEFRGVIVSRTGSGTIHERESYEALASLGLPLLASIPERVAVRDARLSGLPVCVYDPNSPASDAFRDLAQLVAR